MTFFYDLNKKLDEIRATPSKTHGQLNERDMGKHNNATTGFKALAKKAGGGEKGNKIAGAQFQKMKKAGQLEEQTVEESLKDKAKLVGHLAKDMARKGLEKLGHGDDAEMMRDLQRKMGVPPQQQHGKPSMAKSNEDYGPMEAGAPMTAKQKSFAKLAPPTDKITFADKIAGAKKEVDERIGDVAAEAIKNALSPKQKKIDMNKNGKLDANDFAMLRKGGNKQVADEGWDDMVKDVHARAAKPKIGHVERGHKHDIEHTATGRKVTRRVDDQGHSVGADDASDAEPQKRGRGRPAGTGSKMGAKGPSGKSKLMTKENDFDPADRGEYDQEGDMAKDDIKTIVRHAQALEKILGDNDNLPEWVQAKLAKIEGMMTAVDDYMQNQKSSDSDSSDTDDGEMAEERTSKRDNRAERAGRKVAKDIEYDEKRKDGIHGRRRGSEDDKAERAGRRVTKDIEYDEKKKKKKKEVDETTSSGSVATGGSAPKSGGGMKVGTGIYDSLNRQLENMISESMNINMSMNNDDHGGPKKSLTVTATDEDATMLAGLLKMAGLGHGDEHIHAMTGDDSDMDALHSMDHMHGDEPCADCGQTTCECDGMMETLATNPDGTPYVTDIDPDEHDAETARLGRAGNPPSFRTPGAAHADQGGYDVPSFRTPGAAHADQGGYDEMDEAYGDTDASENEPDWPTDEEGTDDAMMYSGGLNGPKSTGQTTVPVIAHQDDRMGSDGDHELRRMMKIAGLR